MKASILLWIDHVAQEMIGVFVLKEKGLKHGLKEGAEMIPVRDAHLHLWMESQERIDDTR